LLLTPLLPGKYSKLKVVSMSSEAVVRDVGGAVEVEAKDNTEILDEIAKEVIHMPAKEGNRRNFRQSGSSRGDSTGNQANRARQGQGQGKSQGQGQGRGKGQFCNGKSWGGQQRGQSNEGR
jgi:hypothetical protein